MKLGEYLLQHVEFNKKQIEAIGKQSYRLGTRHRQLFRFERYPKAVVMTDNASNCLAGVGRTQKGLFVLHDPPMQALFNELPIAKRDSGRGIIGGSLSHWEATEDVYHKSGIEFEYVAKPKGEERNIDFSFAFIINMARKIIEYGYYRNPKGPSGDGWLW